MNSEQNQNDGNHIALREALRWQVEMGADECILNTSRKNQINKPITSSPATVGSKVAGALVRPVPAATVQPLQAAKTLDELRERCATIDSELKRTATKMVFADGNPDADIMMIGEAPGADEDRQGKPFVGVSGQLLDKMLTSIGLDRNTVYITNTILWRPPGNRTPTPQETALFMPYLRQHICLIAPKMIVCLGGAAAKAMLETSSGITKLRGRWHDYHGEVGVIPLLPTLHPAYLLRSPTQKALAWKDLRLLRRKIDDLGGATHGRGAAS